MKTLKKKQMADVKTIEAQTYCMSKACGSYCTCGGQSNSVFQSTIMSNELYAKQ